MRFIRDPHVRRFVPRSLIPPNVVSQVWRDAFHAAGYADDHARRLVATIKSKVAEGLRLAEG